MRLQLIGLVTMCLGSVTHAGPLASIDFRSAIYEDTDRTFVSTSTIGARGTVADRVTLGARYLVDVVSSASADVISAASSTRFVDVRHEASGSAGYADANRSVSAAYVYSRENDWASHTGSLGFAHDLAGHRLTLSLNGAFTHDDVGRRDDTSFHRRLESGVGTLGLAIVASPRDVVAVNYTTGFASGYQASPYRVVRYAGSGSPETVPDERSRHALTLRWNRHLFTDTVLRTHLRVYGDDWRLLALTAGVEYVVGFGGVSLGLHLRAYAQREAGFYEEAYATRRRYMTSDKELSSLVDTFGGVTLGYTRRFLGRADRLHAEAKVDAFGFWYLDYARLRSRAGVVAEVAFGVDL